MTSTIPLNIAHRGARSLAPENTLLAAQKAYDLGADMWELDCGMLADEQIIVVHDDNFKRTTNIAEVFPERVTEKLSTFTLDEVQKLDAGSFYLETDPFNQITKGCVTAAEQESFKNAPIPTLEEALLFTRDHHWRVNVEIKNMSNTPGDWKITPAVVDLILRLGMADQVLISSFKLEYLLEVKGITESIQTAALVALPKPNAKRVCRKYEVSAYHPPEYLLTTRHIQKMRQAGFDVNIWTVNDIERMKTFIEAGATGIITDFPQRMKTLS
ncbi:MAG: hypothetical protein JW750_10300 [Anaerolineaceae bacterium]|nr:hypothetical protein [Anaerolineaceae bacterium]